MNLETETDVKRSSVDDTCKRQIRDEEKSEDSTSGLGTDQVKKYHKNEDKQRITNLSDGSEESLKMIEPPPDMYTENWESHIQCSLHLFALLYKIALRSYVVIMKL